MGFLIPLFLRWGVSQRFAKALAVGVPLALLALAMAFLWARGTHYKDQRDTARAKVEAVNAKLAVSNASIATLEKSLAEFVGAGKAAQAASTAALAAQQPRNAELQAQADAIRAEMAKAADGGCETPASVKGAKGL